MVFSDPVFLFVFLPVALLAYWLGAHRFRNAFLFLMGMIFYVWGAGSLLLLLLSSITFNYYAARFLASARAKQSGTGRAVLAFAIAANLAVLSVWKYCGFVVAQTGTLLRHLGLDVHPVVDLALPIGISFFTFQCISYVVDVWRGDADRAPRFIDFAAYIIFIPHLIAGPIVRYTDIKAELLNPSKTRLEDFSIGAPRFFWGLAKKILIADQVALIANRVFALPNNQVSSAGAWLGVLAYATQIYFDFSGYSDMAIGLARMFGFTFPENFDRPYSSATITEFWRRWHMSLSRWFRDYVYFPLGGNRGGSLFTYRNLVIVFLLTGVWHGANWTFLIWGCFHGACLVVERATGLNRDPTRLRALRRAVTFALVCIGWAIFRAVDLTQAWSVVRALVIPRGIAVPPTVRETLTSQRVLWLAIGASVVLLPATFRVGRYLSTTARTWGDAARLAVVAAVAPITCMYALSSTFSPFLYFKF